MIGASKVQWARPRRSVCAIAVFLRCRAWLTRTRDHQPIRRAPTHSRILVKHRSCLNLRNHILCARSIEHSRAPTVCEAKSRLQLWRIQCRRGKPTRQAPAGAATWPARWRLPPQDHTQDGNAHSKQELPSGGLVTLILCHSWSHRLGCGDRTQVRPAWLKPGPANPGCREVRSEAPPSCSRPAQHDSVRCVWR